MGRVKNSDPRWLSTRGSIAPTGPLDWPKLDRFGGIHALYRDLIKLRRNLSGTTRGLCGGSTNVHHVNNADKVIGYHRWDKGGPRDDVVVIANFAGRSFYSYKIGLPRGGSWRIRFNGRRTIG